MALISSSSCLGDGFLDATLLLFLIRFGVSNCLINGKNGASSLSGSLKGIDLDQQGFPNKGKLVVSDSIVDIDSNVHRLFVVGFII